MTGDLQLQPVCATCRRPHRPDLPCWHGAYRRQVCEQVYRAKGRQCAECRRQGAQRPATTVDHVIARALGGGDEQRNLEPLCRRHNSEKGARTRLPYDEPAPIAGNGQPISERFR